MKQLSLDVINNQFVEFWSNMTEAGLNTMYDPDALKMTLAVSAAGTREDTGCAYPGALLVHINLVTGIAKRILSMISNSVKVEQSSLVKVCILQHLSKSIILKPNEDEWEIKNRGLNFKYNELEGRIRTGSRSLYYAVQNGVKFTPSEWEAMESIDKEDEDKSARFYDSPITTIVRQANEIASLIERERYKNENK